MQESCSDCGSPLHFIREGSCLIVRCSSPSCDREAITTFPVPIFQDSVRYTILIPALPDADAAALVALNRRFTHGIATTRRLAHLGELAPFEGGALHVWHEAHRLRDAGIPFRIEPDYPFNLDSPATAFGPPDGCISDEP